MLNLQDPHQSATYDPVAGRIVLMFREPGKDRVEITLDPERVPGLINALMEARCQAKKAREAVPLPPPMIRPPAPTVSVSVSTPDRVPIRLRSRAQR